MVHHFHGSYRKTVSVSAVRIKLRKQFLQDSHIWRQLASPFLMDNSPFLVNVLAIQQQAVSPVGQNHQTGVLHSDTFRRHTGDTIYSLINAGIGIQVITELHTYRLQPLDHRVSRKVLGPVETHVFKKMRQSALVVLFQDTTHLLGDIEVHLVLRIFIVTDIVCKSVIQFTDSHFLVHRYRRHLLCPYNCRQAGKSCNGYKSQSHYSSHN